MTTISRVFIIPFVQKGNSVSSAITFPTFSHDMKRRNTKISSAIRVANIGNDYVYIEFGDANTKASKDHSMAMLPNSVETFEVPPDVTHIAFICDGVANVVQTTEGDSA